LPSASSQRTFSLQPSAAFNSLSGCLKKSENPVESRSGRATSEFTTFGSYFVRAPRILRVGVFLIVVDFMFW
jgi:hypothetical protein